MARKAALADRVVELRRVKANELLEHPLNWRKHPKAQKDAIKNVLAEIGFAGAILAREDADGRLVMIDGHLRADMAGKTEVPVLVTNLTEEEAEALLFTYDPIGAMAEADLEALKRLADLNKEHGLVTSLLDPVQALYGLAKEGPTRTREVPEAKENKADELLLKWRVCPGDIWTAGPHRLACGDSRDADLINRLFGNLLAALVWTDPPYGVDYGAKNAHLNAADGGNRIETAISGDALKPEELEALITASLRQAHAHTHKGCPLYMAGPAGDLMPAFLLAFAASGFTFKHGLIWLKQMFVLGRSDYHYKHEMIFYGWDQRGGHYFVDDRTQTSVFEFDKPSSSTLHPTMKPPELVERCVLNSSRPGDVVYDPFSGSGTTVAVAAANERVGLGCELQPAYCSVILERWQEMGLTPEKEVA